MNAHWHEQIQRCMTGDATPEEFAALQRALKDDAELRALYLDYMNLDVALGAAAEAAMIAENGFRRTTTFPQPPARRSSQYWPWLAAAAACVALVVFVMVPKHRYVSRAHPDLAATISSSQSAIARLSIEPPSLFPSWASPTTSLLDQPQISK